MTENLKRKLNIANRVLEKYNIEPITEEDIIQTAIEIQRTDSEEQWKLFEKLCKHIREHEKNTLYV